MTFIELSKLSLDQIRIITIYQYICLKYFLIFLIFIIIIANIYT